MLMLQEKGKSLGNMLAALWGKNVIAEDPACLKHKQGYFCAP